MLFHGALLLSGSYQRTYDAYVHIFMAAAIVRFESLGGGPVRIEGLGLR